MWQHEAAASSISASRLSSSNTRSSCRQLQGTGFADIEDVESHHYWKTLQNPPVRSAGSQQSHCVGIRTTTVGARLDASFGFMNAEVIQRKAKKSGEVKELWNCRLEGTGGGLSKNVVTFIL